LSKNDEKFEVPELTYDKNVEIVDPTKAFFLNSDAEKCPFVNCQLMNEGCESNY
jgi:hypothetical protein